MRLLRQVVHVKVLPYFSPCPSSEALRGVNVYSPFSVIQLVTLTVSANSIELHSTPWSAAAWRRFGPSRASAPLLIYCLCIQGGQRPPEPMRRAPAKAKAALRRRIPRR